MPTRQHEMRKIYSIFDLSGKTAIVTGGGQGIGEAMARGLAEAGANIVVADINRERAEETARKLEKMEVGALAVAVNVSDAGSVGKMVDKVIKEYGRIDILINNAGINRREECIKMKEEDWDEVIEVNLKGTFLCSRAVGKIMLEHKKGKVINLASMLSAVAQPNRGPYAASKGGIVQFTKVLAVEWAPYNINVNAIGPGYVLTELNKNLIEDPQTYEYFTSKIPMGRWSTTQDLVGSVIFLSSRASDYITGQVLYVDGGYLCL
jgi:Dehydrogenases with different specificities (related to short-chain alcohol dehydrogenases)